MEGLEEAIQIDRDCPYSRTFYPYQRCGYKMKACSYQTDIT